jgi:hypothetical protein
MQPDGIGCGAFDVTHGSGGAEVRAADEFRIQITNGPGAPDRFDEDEVTDLLVGYSRDPGCNCCL